MVVVVETVALEELLPRPEKGDVLPHRLREDEPVARIGRQWPHRRGRGRGVGRAVGARDRGEHQDEALGVAQALGHGRPEQVHVDEEDDPGRQRRAGEPRVDLVEQAEIPIGRHGPLARRALAMVVRAVPEPDVEDIDLGVRPRVGDDVGDDEVPRLPVGEAELRVDRDPSPEGAPAVHLGQEALRARRHRRRRVLPAEAGDAERFAGPAVADIVEDEPAPADLPGQPGLQRAGVLDREGFRRPERVAAVRVPALEEGVPLAELHEVAIEPDLGHPLDQIAHMLVADRALDADAAMPVGRRLRDPHDARRQVDGRDRFAVRPGADPPAAELGEEAIGRQEDAARVAAGDDPRGAVRLDEDRVVQLRLPDGRPRPVPRAEIGEGAEA